MWINTWCWICGVVHPSASFCIFIVFIFTGGMVGLCVKRSPLTKVTLFQYLARAICEFSCAMVLCCACHEGFSRPSGLPFSSLGKNQTFLCPVCVCLVLRPSYSQSRDGPAMEILTHDHKKTQLFCISDDYKLFFFRIVR